MIRVGCDLRLDLKLYRVPDEIFNHTAKFFRDVNLRTVNVPGHPASFDGMEVYWGNRINAEIIRDAKQLKWIHFGSLGVNNARCDEIGKRNIVVTNSRGTVERAVAMSALAFLLALARGIPKGVEIARANRFSRGSFDEYFDSMTDLEGFPVVIAGFGVIGKILGNYLFTLGASVSTITKHPAQVAEPYVRGKFALTDLPDAVHDAGAIINLLPYTTETRTVFNHHAFQCMKKGSFFINVGRGETVDETALIENLRSGHLAGAGLDVFEKEPLSDDSELHKLPNVLITPHVAAITPTYWNKEIELFSENLRRYRNGETLLNVVDMTRGY
jgi:phosphoglycerate dehydrogenase-like enzyme